MEAKMQLVASRIPFDYLHGVTATKCAKQRSRIYLRCLDVVEQRMEAGLAINSLILSKILKADDKRISRILAEHLSLRKVICRYQRFIDESGSKAPQ
jgi:hypothetical protein